ncbi:MAG: calcium-binding EGF-like domain-containing protein [Gammaproteobacteria bacterium]|nr:calcium-binding EGF-like domain-containing protein [Gammaproteobacteria bacterium]
MLSVLHPVVIFSDVNDCLPHPCLNGGICTDGIDSHTCTCAAGYTGTICGTSESSFCSLSMLSVWHPVVIVSDVNDCLPNPCLNGGICTDGIDSHTCACAAGYTGTKCEMSESSLCSLSMLGVGHPDINDCSPNPCLNGGTCTN